MITLGNLLLIIAATLFGLAGCIWVAFELQKKKPILREPKCYNREPESIYQNTIDEHTKI